MIFRALILSLVLSMNAAGISSSFGGARAGGSFSGGRSSFSAPAARSYSAPSVSSPRAAGGSYFGGARASGAATITRPSPPPASKSSVGGSAGKPVPSQTTIRETHVYHSAPAQAPGHDGFFTGFLFGNLLHQQQQAPVIVSTGAPAAAVSAPSAPTPVVTQQPAEEGTSWLHVLARVLLWLVILSAIGVVGYYVWRWLDNDQRSLWQ